MTYILGPNGHYIPAAGPAPAVPVAVPGGYQMVPTPYGMQAMMPHHHQMQHQMGYPAAVPAPGEQALPLQMLLMQQQMSQLAQATQLAQQAGGAVGPSVPVPGVPALPLPLMHIHQALAAAAVMQQQQQQQDAGSVEPEEDGEDAFEGGARSSRSGFSDLDAEISDRE